MIWMLAAVALLVGVGVGWTLAATRKPKNRHGHVLQWLATELTRGAQPERGPDDTPELTSVLDAIEQGWGPKNQERARYLQEALGRIAAFLREQVREPLKAALDAEPAALRDAAGQALGGLDDLEFFLRDPLTPDEVHSLVPLVQQVTREFTSDWHLPVRLITDDQAVRAHIHRDTFLDAVYLLLHNAGQFGAGRTIDVSVVRVDGRASVKIRDRGPGFSAEALERAHDLFYTTSPSALGLGIPFARKIIESFGGEIQLRNPEDGGAEVELTLPLA